MPANHDESGEFERFGRLVLGDPSLHDQLRGAVDEPDFVALAVRLGRERGCCFSEAIVTDAIREKRRRWLERWL